MLFFVVVAAGSFFFAVFCRGKVVNVEVMAFFDLRCYFSVFSGLFPSLEVSKGLQSSV